jgi:hypothetical protein
MKAKSNTLLGFCGLKLDHACVTMFKHVIGANSGGYDMIMQAFSNNQIARGDNC